MSTAHTTHAKQVTARLAPFGETIFTEMSRLALAHGAIDLGQGFPDFDGPDFVKDAAIEAIRAGHAQYARMYGIPALCQSITDRFAADTGMRVDPDTQVTVTSGCTEALAASFLGLIDPARLWPAPTHALSPCGRRISTSTRLSCGPRSPAGPARSSSTRRTIRRARCSAAKSSS
jgi:aspartate/methionine/tyrosine aminotransferase